MEAIANRIKAKVCEAVFPKDQSFDAMEVFDGLDILISDFSMRQIYLIRMRSDDQIFYGGSLGPALGVETHHDLLQFIELALQLSILLLKPLILFLDLLRSHTITGLLLLQLFVLPLQELDTLLLHLILLLIVRNLRLNSLHLLNN